ncbi:MAG: SpoIIE family protein phosphatase, partial [Methyloligellaceae bacterium]
VLAAGLAAQEPVPQAGPVAPPEVAGGAGDGGPRADRARRGGHGSAPVGVRAAAADPYAGAQDKLLARDEIEVARQVQLARFPQEQPRLPGWAVWSYTRPANDVGGDLVDYIELDSGRLGVALGDVAGKGLGAALLTAKLQATLRALVPECRTLDELGGRLNTILHRDGLDNRYATLFYLELAHEGGHVRFLNAGHNPAIVQDVKLYAGGFPAIFGDRLSSVLSVTSRDGATGKWLGGRIGASLTNANLLLEGKTNFWNGSWMLSGRRSYYDLFSRDFVRDLGISNDVAFPDFRDAHAKLVLLPSPKHRLQLTGFYSENNMDYLVKEEIGEQVSENPGFDGEDRMENTILGGSWTYTPSERLQTRLYSNWYQNNGRSGLGGSLSSSGAFAGRSFSTGEAILTTPPGGQADTLSFDFNQRYSFRKFSIGNWWIYTSQKHIFEFGFGVDRLDNTLNSVVALDEYGELVFDALASAPNFFGALADAIDQGRSYSRANVYLQDKILVRDGQFWLQPGIRYDYYGNIEKSYFSPRLSLLVKPRPQTSIRLSSGIYRQSPGYEKLLDGGRIFDLLQFSSLNDLIAENGVHFIAGLSEKISDHWNFSIEAYYKKLDDLVVQDFQFVTQPIPGLIIIGGSAPAQPGAYKIETAPALQRTSRPVNNANTETFGVDVFVEKKMASPDERWGASLGLSLGKATQEQHIEQDGLASQQMTFPYDFDRRFAFNAMASFNAGAGL